MTYDPLRLIQFCLEEGIPIQIVDFAASVRDVREHGYDAEQLAGDLSMADTGTSTDVNYLAMAKKALELLAPEPVAGAVLAVAAPVGVARDLRLPADQRDAYILIHIPRTAVERMSSPIVLPGRRPA